MHPPYPPSMTNLERNYMDTEIKVTHDLEDNLFMYKRVLFQFGDTFNYTCPPGYFFDEDRSLPHISVKCHDNGSFSEPEEWKKCVDEKGTSFKQLK